MNLSIFCCNAFAVREQQKFVVYEKCLNYIWKSVFSAPEAGSRVGSRPYTVRKEVPRKSILWRCLETYIMLGKRKIPSCKHRMMSIFRILLNIENYFVMGYKFIGSRLFLDWFSFYKQQIMLPRILSIKKYL